MHSRTTNFIYRDATNIPLPLFAHPIPPLLAHPIPPPLPTPSPPLLPVPYR